jgi:hypothetical protein
MSVANEYATRKDGNQKIVMMAGVWLSRVTLTPEFASVSCELSIAMYCPPGPMLFTSCLERNFFLNLRMNEARRRIGKVFPKEFAQ